MGRIVPPTYTNLLPDDPLEVGEFRLLGRLGSGGMGTAFLAESDDQWVVVKILRPELADNPAFRTRLRRELESLGRLNEPDAISVLASDLDCPAPWFAMEYVEGQTLADRVRTVGPLQGNTLVSFASGLADRIEAIHRSGVTHRDIKPSNIVLSPSGPRIIDFGVALVDERTAMTTSGVMVGTLGWASPEQVAGDSVGPEADVHAWGLSVLYAATGEPPFTADSAAALLYKVVHTQPLIPLDLPAPLPSQLSAALRKDPVARPSMGNLRRGLTDTPTLREPPTGLEPTRVAPNSTATTMLPAESGPQRGALRPSRVALVLILILAAVAAAALLLRSNDDSFANPAPSAASASPAVATTESTSPAANSAAKASTSGSIDSVRPPNVFIQPRTGESATYEASWEEVTVEGPDPDRQRQINALLNDFTNAAAEEYLATSGTTQPQIRGGYDATVEQISCAEPFLCFVQRGSYFPPDGVSSFFLIETLVVNYVNASRVTIEDFVAPNQLGTLVTLTEQAVMSTDEFNQNAPMTLTASYDQFRNAIPYGNGLLVYFSEQYVGSMPSEVYVPWDLSGDRPTVLPRAPSDANATVEARMYICSSSPESLPPLVGSDSNPEATRAIQTILVDVFAENPGPIDGQYGPRTISAVRNMQSILGVVADGQVGPATWSAVQSSTCYGE